LKDLRDPAGAVTIRQQATSAGLFPPSGESGR
jgi:hypothetical protein